MHRISALAGWLGLLAAALLSPSAAHTQQDSLAWIREVDQFGRVFILTALQDGPAGIRGQLRPSSSQAREVEAEVGRMRRAFPRAEVDSLNLLSIDVGTVDSVPGKKLTYALRTPTRRAVLTLIVAEPGGHSYVEGFRVDTSPLRVALTEIIETAKNAEPEPTRPDRGDRYEMRLPGSTWGVEIEIPGFEIGGEEEAPDGSGKMMEARNRETGIMLTLFVERERGRDTPQKCRDLYWGRLRRAPMRKTNVRHADQPPLALTRYLVDRFQDVPLMQQHVHAYYGQGGIWTSTSPRSTTSPETTLSSTRCWGDCAS